MGLLIAVSRVHLLILFGQLQQPTRGAIRRAGLSVSTATRIGVVRIELSYRHARHLSRTAQVLQQQGSERKRPAERVVVAAAGILASPDYMCLIGNARPNPDVVHAVIEERASEPREWDWRCSPSNRSGPEVGVNDVAGGGGVCSDGIRKLVPRAVVRDAVSVIGDHR